MIPPLQRGWLFHENRNNYFSPFDFILNQFDDQLYILCNEFVPGNDNHGQHKSDDKWGQRFWTILLGSFFSTLWQKVNVQSSARLWSPHLSLRGVTLPGINLTKTDKKKLALTKLIAANLLIVRKNPHRCEFCCFFVGGLWQLVHCPGAWLHFSL